MLTCPHCGEKSISVGQKLFVGPSSSGECTRCKKKFGVSWLSSLIVLPFAVAVAAMPLIVTSSINKALPWTIAGILVYLFIYIKWVPLVKR